MIELESIDTILANLKKDPEYYNHGASSSKEQEEIWMNSERF